MTARDGFEATRPDDADVLALRAEQRFRLRDRLQILLSGRVAIEQRVRVEVANVGDRTCYVPRAGFAMWTTDWPWRWGRT